MAAPNPDQITLKEFQDALSAYAPLIETVSQSKGAKPGQKTLAELDVYRYVKAPALFAMQNPSSTSMQLQDVEALVAWKLKHGKFRPTLMKLVSSNDKSLVTKTVKESLEVYKKKSSASAALEVLTRLKGIGPATASLLLAVQDPENVIFFADEAFYWLCSNGKRNPIKYNSKEYMDLTQKAQDLAKRLSVKAVDIERVAYVLMNQHASTSAVKEPNKIPVKSEAATKPTSPVKKPSVTSESKSKSASAKRRLDDNAADESGLRRSKRGKTT